MILNQLFTKTLQVSGDLAMLDMSELLFIFHSFFIANTNRNTQTFLLRDSFEDKAWSILLVLK